MGTCCDTMAGIVASYHCALTALRNVTETGDHVVRFYSSKIMKINHGNIDLMKLFSKEIYAQRFTTARELIDQLYPEYLSLEEAQPEYLRRKAVTNLLVDVSYIILSPHEADEEIAGLLASEELNEKHLQKGKELLDRLQQEADSEYKEKY